ncbi:hypothetical protein J7E49_10775 [Variovorax paradoxus]|nr:hypothetical protein [Variovorax paradoxus]
MFHASWGSGDINVSQHLHVMPQTLRPMDADSTERKRRFVAILKHGETSAFFSIRVMSNGC